MDRGSLSDKEVVAASRDFVCVRLATYESAEEGEFLQAIFRSSSGLLENTVFAFLAPDGKTPIGRPARGPEGAFRGAAEGPTKELLATMSRIHAQHPGDKAVARGVPWIVDLRRGLNVAACDLLPLVVVSGRAVDGTLARLAWSAPFIGRLEYVSDDLAKIEGAVHREGIVVVEPDAFGLKGKLLAQSASTSEADLRAALEKGLKAFTPRSKDSRKHIDEGVRKGIRWETEIPVTDPKAPKRP